MIGVPDPRRFRVTVCRALAVLAAVDAPLWFAYGAALLWFGQKSMDLWLLEATSGPRGTAVALLVWLAFALPYGPLFVLLPLTGRFARGEKWRWFAAFLLACCAALPFAVMAGFWWALAGRIERGELASGASEYTEG